MAMKSLDEAVRAIETREDFVEFIGRLRRDLDDRPDGWENVTLPHYLEALQGFSADFEGWLKWEGRDSDSLPPWGLLGLVLLAAAQYE